VIHHAHGWIKERLESLIQQGKPAFLNVDDFNAEIAAFLPRCDFKQILIAIAGKARATADEIAVEEVRTYVQQLDLIEYSEEDIIECINQFLRASAERAAWSKVGIVHERSFDDYEEALVNFWKNREKAHRVMHKDKTLVERGQVLLADCSVNQQKLQGLEVPSFFTPGSYHALAEDEIVGWHPDYATLLKARGKHGDTE
jgi:hypothetical protein